nr:transcriptional adapter 2-alpha isoform X1 [Leptinotarsa decemlineata]
MMTNTNTDLTEEDAADLQFPKEDDLLKFSNSNDLDQYNSTNCENCSCEVVNKWILCDKCNVNICLTCFSSGSEFFNHKNDHDYKVLSTKFTLFENSDWTAEEELKLLDSIMNYGNWNLVAQEFPNRTVNEVINHYDSFYLDRKGSNKLPKLKDRVAAVFPQVVVPYRFRLSDSDEPPRYLCNTIGFKSLAGYNPARSDFESEYDKNAEDLLSHMEIVEEDDPQYELLTNLQCSLVESYNRRLRERQRWKTLMREHGLILLRKTMSWLHRYDFTIQKPVYEKLIRFMQFCEPVKFNMLMEGIHRVGELKLQISRLLNLRRKGITSLDEGRLFLKLNQLHEANRKSLKAFRTNPLFSLKNKDVNLALLTKFNRRRTFAPIEVTGMPGYSQLSEKEIELCSTVRLVPMTYFQLRDVLVAECKKNGYVALQTARRLLKIDVNKTRKLYDFLIQEGYITSSV